MLAFEYELGIKHAGTAGYRRDGEIAGEIVDAERAREAQPFTRLVGDETEAARLHRARIRVVVDRTEVEAAVVLTRHRYRVLRRQRFLLLRDQRFGLELMSARIDPAPRPAALEAETDIRVDEHAGSVDIALGRRQHDADRHLETIGVLLVGRHVDDAEVVRVDQLLLQTQQARLTVEIALVPRDIAIEIALGELTALEDHLAEAIARAGVPAQVARCTIRAAPHFDLMHAGRGIEIAAGEERGLHAGLALFVGGAVEGLAGLRREIRESDRDEFLLPRGRGHVELEIADPQPLARMYMDDRLPATAAFLQFAIGLGVVVAVGFECLDDLFGRVAVETTRLRSRH